MQVSPSILNAKSASRACLQNLEIQDVKTSDVRRIWIYGELHEAQTTQDLRVLIHAL